ncbi:MAG: hypothetical protein O7F73_15355 [Gammaproteobacteria bacterium]|nr:hypothetical protein [Gammaproteobacteria bacterium]
MILALLLAPAALAQQPPAYDCQQSAGRRGFDFWLGSWRVRQFFEERDQDGRWQVWFDGYYTRE